MRENGLRNVRPNERSATCIATYSKETGAVTSALTNDGPALATSAIKKQPAHCHSKIQT